MSKRKATGGCTTCRYSSGHLEVPSSIASRDELDVAFRQGKTAYCGAFYRAVDPDEGKHCDRWSFDGIGKYY